MDTKAYLIKKVLYNKNCLVAQLQSRFGLYGDVLVRGLKFCHSSILISLRLNGPITNSFVLSRTDFDVTSLPRLRCRRNEYDFVVVLVGPRPFLQPRN